MRSLSKNNPMNVLLKNAYLPANHCVRDIASVEGRIHFPVPGEAVTYDRITDLEGKIVFKGFADIHTHLDKTMVTDKVKNRSGTLSEAIRIMGPYKASMTEEDVLERAEKTIRMAYSNGTRYIRTHIDVDKAIGLTSVRALKKLREKYRDVLKLELVAFPQEGIAEDPANYAALDEALAAGCDLVGGIPANEQDPAKHIRMIFDLAKKYDVDVDMHIDENDDPSSKTILELAKQTVENGYEGRVFAGHLCSMASMDSEEVNAILPEVKKAGIQVISLPSTNLYLEGRGDTARVRRGIAPIKKIYRETGIPTAIASDNIRDPFNPFGNGNPLETALITAHGCHMGGVGDLEDLFDMIHSIPMKMMGLHPEYSEGENAPLLVLDAWKKDEAIISQSIVLDPLK